MQLETTAPLVLEDIKVNVKLKLSALWAVLMIMYVYVDIVSFYKPGTVEGILNGKVWVLDITQSWAIMSLVMMAIPSLMIFLSLTLAPKWNRWINIIVASLYLIISIGNAIGESWLYYFIGAFVESVVLLLVIGNAWRWPKSV